MHGDADSLYDPFGGPQMNSLTCGRGSYSCTDHRSLVFAWQVTLRFGHTRSISDLSTRSWLSSKVISVAPAEPRCGLWCHGVASELGTIFNLAVGCQWVHHLRCCSFKMQQGHYRSFLQRYQALATPSVMDFRVPWVQVPLSLSLFLAPELDWCVTSHCSTRELEGFIPDPGNLWIRIELHFGDAISSSRWVFVAIVIGVKLGQNRPNFDYWS